MVRVSFGTDSGFWAFWVCWKRFVSRNFLIAGWKPPRRFGYRRALARWVGTLNMYASEFFHLDRARHFCRCLVRSSAGGRSCSNAARTNFRSVAQPDRRTSRKRSCAVGHKRHHSHRNKRPESNRNKRQHCNRNKRHDCSSHKSNATAAVASINPTAAVVRSARASSGEDAFVGIDVYGLFAHARGKAKAIARR